MSVLIISLPRTGSTELGMKISNDRKLKYVFEPFNNVIKSNDFIFEKCVLKTIIFQIPQDINKDNRIDWLVSITKNFDETILLSRRDLIACAESWAFLNHRMALSNWIPSKQSITPYFWEKTPNYEIALRDINKWSKELEDISNILNIPITYYEDIYDINSDKRLRKGNKIDLDKKLI